MELVWENGQLLMPVLSAAASCTSYSPHSPKAPVNNNDRDIITKRPRLENVDSSILGDFPGDRELNKHDSSLQNGLPGLYETNFNMFQETTKNNTYDKHITESHVVPVHKTANSRSGKPSKFVAQIPRFTTPRNDQLHSSSVEQRQASAPFGRPMVNTSQTQVSVDGLPNSLPWPDSGPDKHLALQNFSLFLRPATLLKANGKSSGATRPTSCQNSSRLEQLKSYNEKPPASGTNPVELTLAEPAGGSKISKGFQENQTDPERTNMEPTRPIAKPPEEAPLDEQSQAIVHKDAFASKRCSDQVLVSSSSLAANKIKAKPDTGNSTCQLAPATSICSRGASNYPTCSLKRSYEDTEGMPYPSKVCKFIKFSLIFWVSCPLILTNITFMVQHANEKQAGATEVMPARGSAGAKRRRTAKVHKLSERVSVIPIVNEPNKNNKRALANLISCCVICKQRRRDKINKKMRALQELVPNSNKVSILYKIGLKLNQWPCIGNIFLFLSCF